MQKMDGQMVWTLVGRCGRQEQDEAGLTNFDYILAPVESHRTVVVADAPENQMPLKCNPSATRWDGTYNTSYGKSSAKNGRRRGLGLAYLRDEYANKVPGCQG